MDSFSVTSFGHIFFAICICGYYFVFCVLKYIILFYVTLGHNMKMGAFHLDNKS